MIWYLTLLAMAGKIMIAFKKIQDFYIKIIADILWIIICVQIGLREQIPYREEK